MYALNDKTLIWPTAQQAPQRDTHPTVTEQEAIESDASETYLEENGGTSFLTIRRIKSKESRPDKRTNHKPETTVAQDAYIVLPNDMGNSH